MLLIAMVGLFALTGTPATYAQTEEKVYNEVDKSPEFPGGFSAMYAFMGKTIRYPEEASRKRIQGKVVTAFVVGEDGTIRDIVIEKSAGYGMDEEAVRVIKAMPKWIPGERQGQKVAVYYKMPINFALN